MGKKTKRIVIAFGLGFAVIVLILAAATWRYPFSGISFHQSITYKPDKDFINTYLQDIKSFKQFYDKQDKRDDVTTDRLQYVLETYEKPWLTSSKPMNITRDKLDMIDMQLRQTSHSLIELGFTQNYHDEARKYLKLMLMDFLAVQDQVEHLKHATNDSRKVLKLQMRNLQMTMASNFDHMVTFYKLYKNAK
ncbi:hypothetical protein P5G51_002495 [Virgibacillus sp. 179-BFC.A HS]|uniref:Uncharacterized protein n=1 Tax=Tigheibacillus jepli TaxID=3035914 RepID=A0ABU5CDL6_9BACI|nr:hypothetical protein [Virgibacillus sp. 179-BFC.A HS]MDY0404434.1 hypothetical protein [Virgibacillus sp. 179-BFC.A HS]